MCSRMRIDRESSSQQAQDSNGSTVRERVLQAACELFGANGFHGTHLREICHRAGTNVAGVCYHFESKEGLYQAVMMEAGRQLSDLDIGYASSRHLLPEKKLLAIIESLLQRLRSKQGWIAKLLAWELVDCARKNQSFAAARLEHHSIFLQAAMRKIGASDSEAMRLHALTLIADCVFYTLIETNPEHPLNQLAVVPSSGSSAKFLAERSIKALQRKPASEEVANP